MVWHYITVKDTESRAHRLYVLDQASRWWSAFAARREELETAMVSAASAMDAGSFDNTIERVLPLPPQLTAWMDEQVAAIDRRLHWECGQEAGGQFFLAITPSDRLQLRPMVHSIVASAPKVPGWAILGYRPPIQPYWAVQAARQRTGLNAIAPSVLSRLGSHNRIDMTFKMKAARDDEASAVVLAAGLAEAIVGEEAFIRWVGEIDVEPLDRGPAPDTYLGLSQLRPTVTGLIQTLTHSLSERPLHEQEPPRKWPTFRYTPSPAGDYPRQDDLTVGRSIVPAVRAAAFGEGPTRPLKSPFYSTSFSRCGETFCYLKIDLPDITVEQRRKRKYQVEEPLDSDLRRAGVGCVIGSSTGLRYIYLDLAILDVKKALAVIVPVLRMLQWTERTWLLFYDTEMTDEYIGLTSTSGAPPAALPGTVEFSRRPVEKPKPQPPAEESPTDGLSTNELLF